MPPKSTYGARKKQPTAKAATVTATSPAATSAPTVVRGARTGAQPEVSAVAEDLRDVSPAGIDPAATDLTPEVAAELAILRGEYSICFAHASLIFFFFFSSACCREE
jgi:hypothetical protein